MSNQHNNTKFALQSEVCFWGYDSEGSQHVKVCISIVFVCLNQYCSCVQLFDDVGSYNYCVVHHWPIGENE